jgi:uncharacterized DUF497 family protein
MQSEVFQWDDRKAAKNYAKQGVRFEAARDIPKDVFAIEQIDDRADYGGERLTIIGMVNARLLFVVYTRRGSAIRIISARGASAVEQRTYHEQND